MTAAERRERIYTQLTTAPVSATALAKQFSVSRQVIVGDIALLRATGYNIIATARGYIIPSDAGLTYRIATSHTAQQTREELYLMVDCGCTVQDVIVEHPVYGQLTAALQLSSRFDVDQFVEKMTTSDARPLSLLTEGIHLHTVSCPSEEVFLHLQKQLRQAGMLWEN
ncbi:MAG: transcription repressor NadR [Ruminococcaceae bacterium]|nr:transcription repressor NadR [Oscillospiraceae bacterium]